LIIDNGFFNYLNRVYEANAFTTDSRFGEFGKMPYKFFPFCLSNLVI